MQTSFFEANILAAKVTRHVSSTASSLHIRWNCTQTERDEVAGGMHLNCFSISLSLLPDNNGLTLQGKFVSSESPSIKLDSGLQGRNGTSAFLFCFSIHQANKSGRVKDAPSSILVLVHHEIVLSHLKEALLLILLLIFHKNQVSSSESIRFILM
jgi:hypothetical protein